MLYPNFTVDDEGKLPTDKKVAEERFQRRKEFLENYHDIQKPWVTYAVGFALVPIMLFLLPLSVARPARHEATEEEMQEKKEREGRLRDFLVEDMKKERKAQQALHPDREAY